MNAHTLIRSPLARLAAGLALALFAPLAAAQGCSLADTDRDGIHDCLEQQLGLDPHVKDNDVQGNSMLFAMQQFRDFLQREASIDEGKYWANQIDFVMGRGRMAEQLMRSTYYFGVTAPITRLYQAYFLRIPDR